ncbi:FG-GAP-like repeat-containing protein [Sphingomonas flavescens]|uniref:FG-GAP-like repeat-containing protein n=1 Tax=Sphingomonas flavescens TaxID=3132797 RepID=UPI0028062883|nr:FG-GAP-like repeat-containing protein [Sphingomonas limnosediminicola]
MAVIVGTAGDDVLFGKDTADDISGLEGNDVIYAGAGDDTVSGGAGNDTVYGQGGNDTIDGGDGIDSLYGDDMFAGSADGNDILRGGAGADNLHGGGGNDDLDGGADRDSLEGGLGADHLDGGDGDDSLNGYLGSTNQDDYATDVLLGGAGDDSLAAQTGDIVDGGIGNDTLYFNAWGASAGINVDFRTLTSGNSMTVAGASLTGIEYVMGIMGSNFDDVIVAGAVQGVKGANIQGFGGNDTITGSAGVDWIYGGAGNDVIYGGIGFDPSTSANRDNLNGDDGDDIIYIGADGAIASGGNGNDQLFGGSGSDELRGDAGDDILSGGAGVDGLNGGEGNDTYIDTAANLNGDYIGSIEIGDKIIITDANINNFTFSLTGKTLNFTGGSLNFNVGEIQGTFIAAAAPGGGVQITLRQPPLATIDAIAQQLVTGYWNGDAHHFAVQPGGSISVDISTLSTTEQNLARAALQEWTDIIGIRFQEVVGNAQITFDHSEGSSGSIAATDATWANGITSHAHIQISSSWLTQNGGNIGSYGFQTYVHEIGHALGLGHPGTYNFDGSYYSDALFADDAWSTSVMSYFNQQENLYFYKQNFTVSYAMSPMQADIIAAQSMYGAATDTRTGDTVYGFNSNAGGVYDASKYTGALTIYDSGGIDTLDYRYGNSTQIINLNPETFSSVNSGRGNLSIARGVVIENAIGGGSADFIIGNGADNVLTGGSGSDTLTGGGGNDTFRDSKVGLGYDKITDFGPGDRIVVTDLNINDATFSLVGDVFTYTGGWMTLQGNLVGHLSAKAAVGGGVQFALSLRETHNDFNGDGRSDILWRSGSGAMSSWLANASGGYTAAWGTSVSTDWKIVGSGDFDGDGRADILWRSDSGAFADWLGASNGGFSPAWGTTVSSEWKVAGAGDFNGDGRDDVLWRSDSGAMASWLGAANGGFSPAWGTSVATEWKIVGTGDFNGDGRDDMLWRSDAGAFATWLGAPNGGFTPTWGTTVGTEWEIAGTGDFNGDGRSDVLWRSDTGTLATWLGAANGGFAPTWSASVAANLALVSIGDFNGDGRDDVVWQNDNGQLSEWLGATNGGLVENASWGLSAPTGWAIQDAFA